MKLFTYGSAVLPKMRASYSLPRIKVLIRIWVAILFLVGQYKILPSNKAALSLYFHFTTKMEGKKPYGFLGKRKGVVML